MEETAVSSTENKSEFLLTDYFVSMEWKEVPLMGNPIHRLRDAFGKTLRAIVKEISCFMNENIDFFHSLYK